MRIDRLVQCKKCPWKKSVNPHDIPNGYSCDRHARLENTIARGSAHEQLRNVDGDFHVMACHESPMGAETTCIGWLSNQLGSGNNIRLRLQVMRDPNWRNFRTVGEQHETFEDTLPKGERL